jgi:hypothetical protein
MLNDVYFVDLQMTGLHWIYTISMLCALYTVHQILTIQLAPEMKRFFKEKFKKKTDKVGFK